AAAALKGRAERAPLKEAGRELRESRALRRLALRRAVKIGGEDFEILEIDAEERRRAAAMAIELGADRETRGAAERRPGVCAREAGARPFRPPKEDGRCVRAAAEEIELLFAEELPERVELVTERGGALTADAIAQRKAERLGAIAALKRSVDDAERCDG